MAEITTNLGIVDYLLLDDPQPLQPSTLSGNPTTVSMITRPPLSNIASAADASSSNSSTPPKSPNPFSTSSTTLSTLLWVWVWLIEDYGLSVATTVDLCSLAANYGMIELRNAGLKNLSREVLGKEIEKPKRIMMSRWDNDWLCPGQVQYACIDAFLSFEIGSVPFHPRDGVEMRLKSPPFKLLHAIQHCSFVALACAEMLEGVSSVWDRNAISDMPSQTSPSRSNATPIDRQFTTSSSSRFCMPLIELDGKRIFESP
ncbi:hypothetical protein ACSBR2_004014 [Camellia fascicularis]